MGLKISRTRHEGFHILSSSLPVMDAIHYTKLGLPYNVLKIVHKELPVIKEDEVMIKIAATNASRYDVYQRTYSILNPILGMECSGIITEVGSKVNDWHVGDKVCAFLMGGGYAQFVAVRSRRVMTIPKGISLCEAASLPFAGCVVWQSLFRKENLPKYCSIMIHDGCSSYGPLAIGLARTPGCTIFVTTKRKAESKYCKSLGAQYCFDYNDKNLVSHVLERTGRRGWKNESTSRFQWLDFLVRTSAWTGAIVASLVSANSFGVAGEPWPQVCQCVWYHHINHLTFMG